MDPKVSVIIPVYNVEAYLPQCLDSVVNQTYKNLEIICVNDGSTDTSLEILERYARNDQRIKIINKKNGGISDARNIGTANATGTYIMYLDSDDWLETNICKRAVYEVCKEKADVVFWNYIREFDTESKYKYIWGKERRVFEQEDIPFLQRRFVGLYGPELKHPENADSIVPVWGKLYRAEIIFKQQTTFVDTRIVGTCEDALFNLEVFQVVRKAIYLPECANHYRKVNNSSFTKTYKDKLKEQWDNLHNYMRKYIEDNHCDDTFYMALQNRISLSIIGLGMNALRGDSVLHKMRIVKGIICDIDYRNAVKKLELKYFPIHWRIFFLFAKCKCTLGVYLLLACIKKLKGS